MRFPLATLFFLATLLISVSAGAAADDKSRAPSSSLLSWQETAAQIDTIFTTTWDKEHVVPADLASDEEFIRRVYLDLAGRVPAVSEVREFLSSDDENRRIDVVEGLLEDPAYVRHMTIVWRNALIPQALTDPNLRGLIPGFEAWLWERIATNVAYNQLVKEIITVKVTPETMNPAAFAAKTSPDAFFLVRELKPENLTTGTARAFLGIRLDCAQCHDHPFDQWKQQQFWNLAAFYGGFAQDDSAQAMAAVREQTDRRSIRMAGSDEVVPAIFLTGDEPPLDPEITPRSQLADWIVSPDNPWFASMAANRLWAQFFGQGIVDPIDDFSKDNPPSHPEVLELLSDQFAAHDYDLQFLIRTIVATRVYQRSGIQTHTSQQDPTMFARAAVRGLTPEQFFDSLAESVGFYQPYRRENPFVIDDNSPRGQFIELFRNDAESPLDHHSTILQALAMMNGDFIGDATSLESSRTLRAVTEFPLMSAEEKLDTLFLAAFSRRPTGQETDVFLNYVTQNETTDGQRAALADVFWALLNSSEFLLNH